MAGAVSRAARRVCGARCRRWAPVSVCEAGAVSRGSRRVLARGVAAGCRSLSVWQAQYPEPLEGVAARGVAAGRRPACRRSYIGVCRGGVCVTDLCRRSYRFAEEVSV